MKTKQINRIMYAAAILLLAALATYLFRWSQPLLNTFLIITTLLAQYPALLNLEGAPRYGA